MNANLPVAEDVSQGTFDRLNLNGCIFGVKVLVPHFPDRLQAIIVGLIDPGAGKAMAFPESASVRFIPSDSSGEEVLLPLLMLLPDVDQPIKGIILLTPVQWWFLAPGSFRFEVAIQDGLYGHTWEVLQGAGRTKSIGAPDLTSAILGASSRTFDVRALAESATSELSIVDPYLLPEDLQAIISGVAAGVRIRVLIPPKHTARYGSASGQLQGGHPNIEIRIMACSQPTGVFHDRFVGVNASEIYWFGTSLKSVSGNRVNRVAKLYRADEVKELSDAFASEWTNETPL